MKPAAFDYVRAETADEAVQQLKALGPEARILAGGQSLMAVLNMRLAQPSVLIDISRTDDLDFVRSEGGMLAAAGIAIPSVSSGTMVAPLCCAKSNSLRIGSSSRSMRRPPCG